MAWNIPWVNLDQLAASPPRILPHPTDVVDIVGAVPALVSRSQNSRVLPTPL